MATTQTSTAGADALRDEPQLTLAGVLFESAQGLVHLLAPGLRSAGLSEPWFEILIRLYRTPGRRLRLADLSTQTRLTASGVTRALDRLEHESLACRSACPSDRRGTYAELTEAGAELVEAYLPKHLTDLATAFNGSLTQREQEQLTRLLTKLRDHVRPGSTAGARGPDCP